MTYKALVKTAESYLYDAQSDLQVLGKRHDKETPVFVTSLRGVELALNDIEMVLANDELYERGAVIYTVIIYIDITSGIIGKAKRQSDRSPIKEALLRAGVNLKDALKCLGW